MCAFMNQDRKKVIAQAVKPVLAKYGVKGSLKVRNHMTIVLTIKEGKLDFWNDRNREAFRGSLADMFPGHLDVNPYHHQTHYTGQSKAFFAEVFQALKAADWYDKSDAMVDYFNTAYYMDVQVGKWDKPYVLRGSS